MDKVKSVLKRYSALREYIVLSDITLKVGEKEVKFDKLMIGCFGILCLCCFDKKGELYGSVNDQNFVLVDKKMRREKTDNITKRCKEQTDALRQLITDQKIYNVKIDSVIVISNSGCSAFVSNSPYPIMNMKEFKKYLNSTKFELDNKVDAKMIQEKIKLYTV